MKEMTISHVRNAIPNGIAMTSGGTEKPIGPTLKTSRITMRLNAMVVEVVA
jgi:hypothetical protein